MLIVTTAVCFGFGLSNPVLSTAASNAVGKTAMGVALGMVKGFGSFGRVGGLILAGPLYDLGDAHYSFGFGVAITLPRLAVDFLLHQPLVSA